MLIPGGFGATIQGKTGFGIIGAVAGGTLGAAAGGWQVALVGSIAAGLIGVIGGTFFDGDYQDATYCNIPQQQQRAWASVGYTVLLGLGIALFGIILTFFVPDWRPLLIASMGMLFVVIALSYGGSLVKR
jgi:hypothetical protein